MTLTLYVATTNPGKLRDFASALTPGLTLLPLPGLAGLPEAPEDEPTFLGNATSKALFYARLAPGLTVLADDSGLEVDALGGAPGVRSARYADDSQLHHPPPRSPPRSAQQSLPPRLPSPAPGKPIARPATAASSSPPATRQVLASSSGSVEGEILAVPRGNGGFGYDPLFLLPDEGRTMAELAPEERHLFSHRGRALEGLLGSLSPAQANPFQ